jgi:hypothetical protein
MHLGQRPRAAISTNWWKRELDVLERRCAGLAYEGSVHLALGF